MTIDIFHFIYKILYDLHEIFFICVLRTYMKLNRNVSHDNNINYTYLFNYYNLYIKNIYIYVLVDCKYHVD